MGVFCVNKYLTSVDFINDRFDTEAKYHLLERILNNKDTVDIPLEELVNDIRTRIETGIIKEERQYTIEEFKEDLCKILDYNIE